MALFPAPPRNSHDSLCLLRTPQSLLPAVDNLLEELFGPKSEGDSTNQGSNAQQNMLPERYRERFRLGRFLVGKANDVSAAAAQIRADATWRKENGIDDVLDTFPRECPYFGLLQAYWPSGYHGKDKYGLPVYVERFGLTDPPSAMAKVSLAELLRFHVYIMESAERLREAELLRQQALDPAATVEDPGMLYIMDMQNLSFSRHMYMPAVNFGTSVVSTDEEHYPEILRNLLIVNAPSIFSPMWSALSPFLHQRTLSKIRIISGGSETYLPILEEAIGVDVDSALARTHVPDFLGGTHARPDKCNPNNGCIKELGVGGRFGGLSTDGSTVAPVALRVSPNSEHRHVLKISREEATQRKLQLRWDFSTLGNDIGFSLWRIPDHFVASHGSASLNNSNTMLPRDSIEIIKRYRAQCQEKPVTGALKLEGSMTGGDADHIVFVLIWDNTYSLLRGKDLRYEARVDPVVDGEQISDSVEEGALIDALGVSELPVESLELA